MATGILPTPNTSISSLPVGSNVIRNTGRESQLCYFILSTDPPKKRTYLKKCENMSPLTYILNR